MRTGPVRCSGCLVGQPAAEIHHAPPVVRAATWRRRRAARGAVPIGVASRPAAVDHRRPPAGTSADAAAILVTLVGLIPRGEPGSQAPDSYRRTHGHRPRCLVTATAARLPARGPTKAAVRLSASERSANSRWRWPRVITCAGTASSASPPHQRAWCDQRHNDVASSRIRVPMMATAPRIALARRDGDVALAVAVVSRRSSGALPAKAQRHRAHQPDQHRQQREAQMDGQRGPLPGGSSGSAWQAPPPAFLPLELGQHRRRPVSRR